MLHVTLDKENAIAILEPDGALGKEDFDHAVKVIDPFIEAEGNLNGIIIYTKSFPGWKDFAALSRHFTFIKNHHEKIKRLAFVTDTSVIEYTKAIAAPFIKAELKVFDYEQLDAAKKWVREG
ncbi:STAS/SEC14 domain-containing protein [Sulfurovum sp.]|uniref:STAS/SEC14 domain-containing protein n=1 Tax=Sulfurovum sp. TaxID=1969726 RepID=UPI0025FE544C|nr:STAS/SEC14 domain-containing protein [Sulfurovum sp.]